MKKCIWMGGVLAGLLMACSPSIEQKQTVSAGVLEYDSLSIPIDYPCLGFYYQTAYYQEGGSLYWAGYNHWLHSIQVFDLTHRQTVASYELEPEGPNAIIKNQFNNFLLDDSLFVFRTYREGIKRFSRKDGKLQKSIVPLSVEDDFQLNFRSALNGEYSRGFGMRWNGECVIMPLFPKNGQKMEDPLAVSVNLRTSEIERLSLSYPENMKDDLGKYGSLTCPYFTVGKDRIVYNFAYSSQVYVVMKGTDEVQTFAMNSNATSNQSETKDANIKDRNFRENIEYEELVLRFGEVFYDKDSDTYVRIHYDKSEAVFAERNKYLMVYKCKTDEMLEYELPKEVTAHYFVADGHAYFQLKNSADSHLYFAVVDLRKL